MGNNKTSRPRTPVIKVIDTVDSTMVRLQMPHSVTKASTYCSFRKSKKESDLQQNHQSPAQGTDSTRFKDLFKQKSPPTVVGKMKNSEPSS